MQLRHHPLMSYRGVPNWPPVWVWRGIGENKRPKGEVGILKNVTPSRLAGRHRCFLVIEYEGATYMGCLLFNEHSFCRQVTKLLFGYCGRSLEDIGALEVSATL
jgi:hypothetical protein